jgi:branched-chain amino acid transport system permease protein
MSPDMLGKVLTVIAALGSVYILMSLGLTLVFGVTKIFNYAQGSFFVWGGYIAWALHKGFFNLHYGLAFAISIGGAFLFGLLYERAIIRPLRRFAGWDWTAVVVTLGSALLLDNLALTIFGSRCRTLPPVVEGVFKFGGAVIPKHDIATILISIAIVIMLNLFLQKTRVGMAIRGVAQDTIGANIVGIPTHQMFGYTFAITAVLGATAGVLLVPTTTLYPGVGWVTFCKAMVVLALGGLGSMKGVVIAAYILSAVEVFTTYYLGAVWALPVYLVILLAILVFRPRGLFGTW